MSSANRSRSRKLLARVRGFVAGRDLGGERGFTLVVTILLTGLLTVMGVAMLSLSTITLKSSVDEGPKRVARANARMALALALGELQTELGDDRRVTADSDILADSVERPNMLGVWDSVAPTSLLDNPQGSPPDYANWKTQLFRKWLVSSSDLGATRHREFPLNKPETNTKSIFTRSHDGFDLQAELVAIESGHGDHGAMAWAVSQEGTKARMNLGGSSEDRLAANDVIQAPSGPNLGLSNRIKQPLKDWAERENRVVSVNQAALDPAYEVEVKDSGSLAADYTTTSQGLLTDVVKGGLKTDLSLGFELGDSDFKKTRWDNIKNPFAATGSLGETPLFRPLNGGGPVNISVAYSPIVYTHHLETGSAPTFQNLRSYYSLYRHLYRSGGERTAFQRQQASAYWPGSATRGSETSVGPVMDRILFFLSVSVDDNDIVNLVVTPVITLWNPYNVAVETEGCVVYPWMDFPINIQWKVTNPIGNLVAEAHSWISTFVGSGDTGEGRSTKPYFFCQLTGKGDGTTDVPIHLAPGEVRVFTPSGAAAALFKRTAAEKDRTIFMKPVQNMDDFHISGGLSIRMNESMWADGDNLNYQLAEDDRVQGIFGFTRDQHNYFVTMEDATRIHNPAQQGRIINEVQAQNGKLAAQSFTTPSYLRSELKHRSQPVAVLETYHRSAGQDGQLSDLVFTANPRQRYVNSMVSASNFAAGPQYESSMRQVSDVIGSGLQVTQDGRRSYFGYSNSSEKGRDYLSFFDLPGDPMISLGAFQNADLADSAFGPASQFGNSWASAFLPRNAVGKLVRRTPGGSPMPLTQPYGDLIGPAGLGIYDHSWLLNTSLWDGFFFSSISPQTQIRDTIGGPGVYDSDQISTRKTTEKVISAWLADPQNSPLRNPRMTLHRGGMSDDDLVQKLSSPAGCREAAAHLMVEGSFNVNSTREAAWCAMLASLRGQAIQTRDHKGGRQLASLGDITPAPRLLNPTGTPGDPWDGFRTLTDGQIKALAKEIVAEIKRRGPAQSLGEFVNRRVSSDAFGLKGTLQAAIDRAGINDLARIQKFDTSKYPYPVNLPDPYTGTGTPGWLTQADLLNAMAPFISVRSDTFTIRAYGEARDATGQVVATAWYEAVVQRVPEWMEAADAAVDAPNDVSPASARFGRRFEIRSFRELSRKDLDA
jgi:hypothetical protein